MSETVTYQSIPSDYEIIKRTECKVVVQSPDGEVLTLWKSARKLGDTIYSGSETRHWERQIENFGVSGRCPALHGKEN